VFGVIAVTQAMLPLLREAPEARIVNVASSGGSLTLNSDPTNPHRAMFGTYSASKAAANAVTVAFAAETRVGRHQGQRRLPRIHRNGPQTTSGARARSSRPPRSPSASR